MTMLLVCISDTHGRHSDIRCPDGDVLIHAGDFVNNSTPDQIREFMAWFSAQPHRYKVLIAGNHDGLFELDPALARKLVPEGVTYLEDSGCEIEGLKFWGSPYTPAFMRWYFMRARGCAIAKHWDMIPEGTDVLITHGPAHGVLDVVPPEGNIGCHALRKRIEAIKPRLHVCGHIHRGYGWSSLGEARMVNASICNEDYRPVHAPIIVPLSTTWTSTQ